MLPFIVLGGVFLYFLLAIFLGIAVFEPVLSYTDSDGIMTVLASIFWPMSLALVLTGWLARKLRHLIHGS